jgi:Kelch motif
VNQVPSGSRTGLLICCLAVAAAFAGCSGATATPAPRGDTNRIPTSSAVIEPSLNQTVRLTATPSGGTFAITGSLPAAQSAATLLGDGRVLVMLGVSPRAELYDPKTGAFTPNRSIGPQRVRETVTRLADGRVLIAGGVDLSADWTQGELSSAELFDPATGRFTATGSMKTARMSHTATLLADGRVLIVGGWAGNPNRPLASAEIYSPVTGTFAAAGSMRTARENQTATRLQDGRVLIAGGDQSPAQDPYAEASAEIFSPTTGTFSPAGSMTAERTRHTATLLPSGRVLIAGGFGNLDKPEWAELFDPATERFIRAASMFTYRDGATATLLKDGSVLVAGGANDGGSLNSAEIYTPSSDAFRPTSSMVTTRMGHTATLLDDGRVLVVGGLWGAEGLSSAELYWP